MGFPVTFRFGVADIIQGFTAAEDFTYIVNETPSTSTSSTVQVDDVEYTVVTGIANNCQIVVTDSTFRPGHNFVSLTPEICTIDDDGRMQWVSDGYGTVEIQTPVGNRRYSRQMVSTGGSTTFAGFVNGSLARQVYDTVNGLVTGKVAGTATQKMWASNNYDLGTPVGVRNAANFAASLDLSFIPMVDVTTWYYPQMLISPHHVIFARHVTSISGDQVFMNAAGATTLAVDDALTPDLPIIGSEYPDIRIRHIQTPVTNITPVKLLPATWRNYLPSLNVPVDTSAPIPVLIKTAHNATGVAENCLGVFDLTGTQAYVLAPTKTVTDTKQSTDPRRSAWGYSPLLSGDSSGPAILPINGEAVLIGCLSEALGGFDTLADFRAEIQVVMNTLSDTYGTPRQTLGQVDLSSFTYYP